MCKHQKCTYYLLSYATNCYRLRDFPQAEPQAMSSADGFHSTHTSARTQNTWMRDHRAVMAAAKGITARGTRMRLVHHINVQCSITYRTSSRHQHRDSMAVFDCRGSLSYCICRRRSGTHHSDNCNCSDIRLQCVEAPQSDHAVEQRIHHQLTLIAILSYPPCITHASSNRILYVTPSIVRTIIWTVPCEHEQKGQHPHNGHCFCRIPLNVRTLQSRVM